MKSPDTYIYTSMSVFMYTCMCTYTGVLCMCLYLQKTRQNGITTFLVKILRAGVSVEGFVLKLW